MHELKTNNMVRWVKMPFLKAMCINLFNCNRFTSLDDDASSSVSGGEINRNIC